MLILGIVFFLFLSAFFSGSEIAFISANKLKIELQREEKSRRAKILGEFFEKPKVFLSTMLVGNNIALVILTYLMTLAIQPFVQSVISHPGGILLANTVLITLVVLIFGEFMPKTLFRHYANSLLRTFAYPLSFFIRFLKWPARMMTAISTFIIRRVFKASEEEIERPFTRADLELLINSNVQNDIEKDIDTSLFTNALNLQSIKVRSCMVPRTEIVTVDIESSISDLIEVFDRTKLSRILVVDGDIEEVKGYVHHQQLMQGATKVKPLILPIEFVPETMMAGKLLNTFIHMNMNIACVVDEFGGVAGIITMEDILEEIFGNIEDEHDEEDLVEISLGQGEWIFSGRHEIDDLNEKYHESFLIPESDQYNTLSGLIIHHLHDIPKKGAMVRVDDIELTVEEVSETFIDRVKIVLKEEENAENAE